jgi:hypothetical protein
MSMTEPSRATHAGTTEVRGTASDSFPTRAPRAVHETKLSFLTTEFWMTLAGVAALIVVYNVADNPVFDLWRMMLLATIGVTAYIVSRGLAKSGSRHEGSVVNDRYGERY